MVVVDSSAIIDLLFFKRSAAALRRRIAAEREKLQAPHLIDLEVTQVIRRFERIGEIEVARARLALDHHQQLPIERHRHDTLLGLIWQLRNNFTAPLSARART